MKSIAVIILALAIAGCGVTPIYSVQEAIVVQGDHMTSTRTATFALPMHFLSDPILAKADLPPGVHLEGFRGQTVVDGIKAVASGIYDGLSRLFVPRP